jgi:hypothetical protein
MYDVLDDRGVPATRGVPTIVRIAAGIGLIVIFIIGAAVIGMSSFGHQWPADKAQRIHLSP